MARRRHHRRRRFGSMVTVPGLGVFNKQVNTSDVLMGVALALTASGAVCIASLASVILYETATTSQDAPIPGVVRALEPIAVTAAAPAVAAAAWCFLGLTVVPGFLRYLRHLSVFAILLTGLLVMRKHRATADSLEARGRKLLDALKGRP